MGYSFSGDIELVQLTLSNSSGQVIDISHIAMEVNIYQSLFKHYLRCDVAIGDSLNLGNILVGNEKENIPVGWTGGETLTIAYRENTDPSKDSEVPIKRHMFVLFEMTDRIKNNEFSEQYLIQGISLEAFVSIPQKIRKSYGGSEGNTIKNMIGSICNEYILPNPVSDLYSKVNIRKTVDIDETSGLEKYVIPSLSVDETIDFLANEADSESHYPYYVFYEDSEGFKFKNVPNLIQKKSEPNIPSYFYFMSNYFEATDDDDIKYEDQYKIIDFSVEKATNILENVTQGLYKAKNIKLDIINKKSEISVFDYQKEKGKFETLQRGDFFGEVGNDDVILSLSTKGNLRDKRNSLKKQIFNNVMNVSIPGDSSLNVGGIIELKFYINNSFTEDQGLDKQLSGKYIITNLRQKINTNIFTTQMTVSKDVSLI
jgi:hypothetical protein